MKTRLIKIICGVAVVVFIVVAGFGVANLALKRSATPAVIASNFVGYDFARAVMGDSAEIAMLLKPGGEVHNFEPTPEDIIRIKNADLFIYVGGESEGWAQKLLDDNGIPAEKALRLMDYVEAKTEEDKLGMDTEDGIGSNAEGGADNNTEMATETSTEYDEHIWTSPANAIKLVDAIRARLAKFYPDKAQQFAKNTKSYTDGLAEIDGEIRQVVAESPKKELIFGDRFPFRYFVDEYGLDYWAAFPGCAEQTEASASTIAFLIDKVRKDGINVILKIELSNGQLAKTIAEEVGAKVLTFNSAHNISREDFDAGVTYADIMEENIKVLKEALK